MENKTAMDRVLEVMHWGALCACAAALGWMCMYAWDLVALVTSRESRFGTITLHNEL